MKKSWTGLDICEEALKHFGESSQACQLMEECAELIVALNKAFNREQDEHFQSVAEEIADVEILIEQLKSIIEIKDYVEVYKKHKLERLAETIGFYK